MTKVRNAGGAATQSGINYQNRVAAWFCVRILAEDQASPLWKLPFDTTIEFLRCETEQPIDDILLGTSNNGNCFINVKHSLKGSKQSNSALASVIHQFTRQFVSYKGRNMTLKQWEREIDLVKDRFVLAVNSKNSSSSITDLLPSVLSKIRDISVSQYMPEFETTLPDSEKEIFQTIRNQVAREWQETVGAKISNDEELQFFIR